MCRTWNQDPGDTGAWHGPLMSHKGTQEPVLCPVSPDVPEGTQEPGNTGRTQKGAYWFST